MEWWDNFKHIWLATFDYVLDWYFRDLGYIGTGYLMTEGLNVQKFDKNLKQSETIMYTTFVAIKDNLIPEYVVLSSWNDGKSNFRDTFIKIALQNNL